MGTETANEKSLFLLLEFRSIFNLYSEKIFLRIQPSRIRSSKASFFLLSIVKLKIFEIVDLYDTFLFFFQNSTVQLMYAKSRNKSREKL